MISAVAVVFKTMGLQSVPKPASCFFCSRQDSLKWCSTSLSPTVILKRAVKSPSAMGKWSPSSITYLLSVIHTLKSSLWLMNLWFMMYPLTDSSAWCSIFWNPVWVFSLLLPRILFLKNSVPVFPFFNSYLCYHANKSLPQLNCVIILLGWMQGLPNLAQRTKLFLTHDGIYTRVSYKGAITLGNLNPWKTHFSTHHADFWCPFSSSFCSPLQTFQDSLYSLGKWSNLSLPFTFV